MGFLDGQVAIVTGGARGQGRAHALALASEGAAIVLCDIAAQIDVVAYPMATADDLAEAQKLVSELGVPCRAVTADVRSHGDMQAVADAALELGGRIDVLCANAGVFGSDRVDKMTPESWQAIIDTDLTGVFNAIRAVAPHMVERRYGRIIATSSVAGHAGYGNLANYCAAKWGIIGLVKSVAIDLGPFNITANAVCPGQVNTPMINNDALLRLWFPDLPHPTQEDFDRLTLETMHYLPVPQIPPADVSGAVLYLASPAGRYVSGSTIDVSAGMAANSMA